MRLTFGIITPGWKRTHFHRVAGWIMIIAASITANFYSSLIQVVHVESQSIFCFRCGSKIGYLQKMTISINTSQHTTQIIQTQSIFKWRLFPFWTHGFSHGFYVFVWLFPWFSDGIFPLGHRLVAVEPQALDVAGRAQPVTDLILLGLASQYEKWGISRGKHGDILGKSSKT